jgi:hypothetical protein
MGLASVAITGFAGLGCSLLWSVRPPGGLMAYDEDLADRASAVMPADAEVTERKMFGGLAFLLRGHMFVGIVGSELMVRLGYEAAQRALELDHASVQGVVATFLVEGVLR